MKYVIKQTRGSEFFLALAFLSIVLEELLEINTLMFLAVLFVALTHLEIEVDEE